MASIARSSRTAIVAGVLLLVHVLLLSWGAAVHSPAWDEVGHLPAGLSHWEFGRFELYNVNPPLVRAVASLPVTFTNAESDWTGLHFGPASRPEFQAGKNFIEINGKDSFWYFTIARWACIPFSLLGGYVCFRWARELYGDWSGLLALAMWCFSPNILAHGQMITPDMGATALGVTAFYLFWHWLKRPGWKRAAVLGLVLGLTELTKTSWIILFALWPALWLVWRYQQLKQPGCFRAAGLLLPEFAQLTAVLLLAIYIINLGYGFEDSGQRLGQFEFISGALGGHDEVSEAHVAVGNRFENTWLEDIPVPLPKQYVLGVDLQKWDFERKIWSYLRGEWRKGGWWYYYLYALAIKVPLGTWLILLSAVAISVLRLVRKRTEDAQRDAKVTWRDESLLLVPMLAILTLVSSQTGFNHHLRYVLPIFPFAFTWTSKVVGSQERRDKSQERRVQDEESRALSGVREICSGRVSRPDAAGGTDDRNEARRSPVRHGRITFRILILSALTWSIASSVWVYPHSLSYFNETVGGPMGGHYHLGNSNIDWGQDLLFLKHWLDQHPQAEPIGLAFDMPLIDPAIAGIDHSEPPPGPDSQRGRGLPQNELGPQPGWYAISVNQLHRDQKDYEYFLQFEPVATAGYSIFIYHITPGEANRIRGELGMAAMGEGE